MEMYASAVALIKFVSSSWNSSQLGSAIHSIVSSGNKQHHHYQQQQQEHRICTNIRYRFVYLLFPCPHLEVPCIVNVVSDIRFKICVCFRFRLRPHGSTESETGILWGLFESPSVRRRWPYCWIIVKVVRLFASDRYLHRGWRRWELDIIMWMRPGVERSINFPLLQFLSNETDCPAGSTLNEVGLTSLWFRFCLMTANIFIGYQEWWLLGNRVRTMSGSEGLQERFSLISWLIVAKWWT